MVYSKEDKDAILSIHLLSGLSIEQTKDFFEAVAVYSLLNYMQGKDTFIPLMGSLKFTYQGDKIRKRGKQAVVESKFDPCPFFLRNIGQIEDKEESDIELELREKIKSYFHKFDEGSTE